MNNKQNHTGPNYVTYNLTKIHINPNIIIIYTIHITNTILKAFRGCRKLMAFIRIPTHHYTTTTTL